MSALKMKPPKLLTALVFGLAAVNAGTASADCLPGESCWHSKMVEEVERACVSKIEKSFGESSAHSFKWNHSASNPRIRAYSETSTGRFMFKGDAIEVKTSMEGVYTNNKSRKKGRFFFAQDDEPLGQFNQFNYACAVDLIIEDNGGYLDTRFDVENADILMSPGSLK